MFEYCHASSFAYIGNKFDTVREVMACVQKVKAEFHSVSLLKFLKRKGAKRRSACSLTSMAELARANWPCCFRLPLAHYSVQDPNWLARVLLAHASGIRVLARVLNLDE